MMSLHMGMKVRFLVESLVTVGKLTREWLLAGVNSLMGFQIKVQREPLATCFALVRFLTCVDKHVSLELSII